MDCEIFFVEGNSLSHTQKERDVLYLLYVVVAPNTRSSTQKKKKNKQRWKEEYKADVGSGAFGEGERASFFGRRRRRFSSSERERDARC